MQLAATTPDSGKSLKVSKLQQVGDFFARTPVMYAVVGLVLLSTLMMFMSDKFLTFSNWSNILRQVSINGMIAVGMTIVILTGGIDLSVGAVMALSMTCVAGAMLSGVPIALAILMALIVGVLCGAVNGALVSYFRLPAIIVTLAMMEIPRGIALLYTGGYPLAKLPPAFAFWGQGQVLGLDTPIVIMLVVFLAAYLLLNQYPSGRYLYGIGGNEEAVRLSGIHVRQYKLLAYTLSGLTAALSGIVLSSRLMSGQPNAGIGFELDAIAAVVLGGTAITVGRGHIFGTLIGAVTLGVLNNGLNLMEVSPYTQRVIKGVIILLAIYASTVKRKD
jgi:ribose transport system permease protein